MCKHNNQLISSTKCRKLYKLLISHKMICTGSQAVHFSHFWQSSAWHTSYSDMLSRVQPDSSEASKVRLIPTLSKEIPILKGNKRKSVQIFQDSSCKSFQFENLTQPDMKMGGKIHPKKKQTRRSYKVSDYLSGEENIRSNNCFKDDICSAGISRLPKDINPLPVLQKKRKLKKVIVMKVQQFSKQMF